MWWPFGGGGGGCKEGEVEEKPIPLVYIDMEEKLRMDEGCAKMLESLEGPVAIVSICGRTHQGKSFLLNQLLGRSRGFKVSSTRAPCTHGLWLWKTPLKNVVGDGTVCNILLLDTEATDTYHLEDTHNIQLISVAVLLSSLLLCNKIGRVDEVELNLLSLVIEMTKHIRDASMGRDIASLLQKNSPIFLLLHRDFHVGFVEDYHKVTPREHLEHLLRTIEMGESIQSFFPERECCTLVRPVIDENDLNRLDQIAFDELRPEFRASVAALKRLIMEITKPKQVGCTIMTGPNLVRHIQVLLDVMNDGVVSTISSAWKNHENLQCLRAYFLGEQFFIEKCDEIPLDDVVSEKVFEGNLKISMALFDATIASTSPICENYRTYLMSAIRNKIKERCNEAQAKASKRAEALSYGLQVRQRKHDACFQRDQI